MQAPTDNIIKSSAIPEPVIKLKSTRKESGSDLSKTEFEKELQDKFKTTIKGIDDFEHKTQTVMFEHDSLVDDKIRYDSTVSEKSFHDYEDPIAKDYQTEKAERSKDVSSVTHTTEEVVTVNNVKENILRQKDSTITTIRFLEQETQDQLHERFAKQTEDLIDPELATKLTAQKDKITDFIQTERELNIPPKTDKSEDVIDPELAAKLTVQKEKIIDFVEPTIDILSPVKCEMKKTISSDCIDSELSAKLSKQKEKAERIVEDELQVLASPVHQVPSTDFGKDFDDQFQKDIHTEKTTKTTTSTFQQKEADDSVKNVTQYKTSAIETKTSETVAHGKVTSETESITKIVNDTILGTEETITSKITDVKTEIQKLNSEHKPSVTQSTVSFLESETKTIAKDPKKTSEPKTSDAHVTFLESEVKSAADEHIPHLGNVATTVITDVKTAVHSKTADKPATQTTITTTKITEQDDQLDDSLERHTSSTTTTTVTEVKSLASEKKPTDIQSTSLFVEEKTVIGDKFDQLGSDASSLQSDIHSLTDSGVPDVKSTISFLASETRSVVKEASSTISDSVKAAEAKSSTGPFVNETDSDEFYKTIEAKITKKLSQDYSAMQQDITSAGKYDWLFFIPQI